jgi:hypothetical protein
MANPTITAAALRRLTTTGDPEDDCYMGANDDIFSSVARAIRPGLPHPYDDPDPEDITLGVAAIAVAIGDMDPSVLTTLAAGRRLSRPDETTLDDFVESHYGDHPQITADTITSAANLLDQAVTK